MKCFSLIYEIVKRFSNISNIILLFVFIHLIKTIFQNIRNQEKFEHKIFLFLFVFFFVQTFEIYNSGTRTLSISSSAEYTEKDKYKDEAEIIIIESGVEEIKSDDFSGWNSLKTIEIGDQVTSIESGAFRECVNLQMIIVSKQSRYYSSDDNGILYDKYFETVICCPRAISISSFTIPDSVTSINDYAFYGCKSLTNITIPNSVMSIGASAFYECSQLETVIIGESVIIISDSAFYSCSSLTNIKIPNSVMSIGTSAFYLCTQLETVIIGESVITIGIYAFSNCSSLKCIYFLGNKSPNFGSDAFSNVQTRSVMTSDLYNGSSFGALSVYKGTPYGECEQYSWPTRTYSQSNTYTQTNIFSHSNIYTKSNTFTQSNSFSQSNTFSEIVGSEITLSFTYLYTNTLSVSYSLTIHEIQTKSFSLYINNSIITYIETEFIYYNYTIIIYSTYYNYYSNFFTYININEFQTEDNI